MKKRLLIILVALFLFIPFIKVNADNKNVVVTFETGMDLNESNGLSDLEDSAMGILISKGIITLDENTGKVYGENDKLLFTISDGVVTLADGITSEDNIEYTLTEEDLAMVENAFEKIYLKFNQSYTVDFDTNGGSEVQSQIVDENKLAVKPNDPTKEDLEFIGWYTEPELTHEYNFNTPVTQNITLYAKWISGVIVTFETGMDLNESNGLDDIQDSAIGILMANGIITLDENTGKVYGENDKLLFTISDGVVTLADGITSEDNIEYTLTEEDLAIIENAYQKIYIRFEVKDQNVEQKEYTITSGDAKAVFTFNVNHDFKLYFFNILSMSVEEINDKLDPEDKIDQDAYNQLLELIKNNVKEYGTLLGLYAIEINDGNIGYSDEVKFTLKLTDEQKKYNEFKFIYLDDEKNFKVGDVVDFKIDGDYITGTLPHLSAYALVGNKKEVATTESSNPKTGDNIILYTSVLGLSIIALGAGLYLKRRKVN